MHRTKVRIVEDALDANNTIAQANRADFDRAGVTVVNFMSAPGAGKTSLLERVVGNLPQVRVGVLEGDVQGSYDADPNRGVSRLVTSLAAAGIGGGAGPDETIDQVIPEPDVQRRLFPAASRPSSPFQSAATFPESSHSHWARRQGPIGEGSNPGPARAY